VRKPHPMRPPAEKVPDMTIPVPGAKPLRKPPRTSSDEGTSRTATPSSAQPTPGSAVAETGARGAGFGLSTGGGGGTGGYLDVQNFCCPDYLATMLQLIQRNWSSKQQVAGEAQLKFTIQKDGRITDVAVERSSGYFALDQTAERALLVTRQLQPLPGAFPEDQLTVHLRFQYQR
jgi:periplasmic protein TonB